MSETIIAKYFFNIYQLSLQNRFIYACCSLHIIDVLLNTNGILNSKDTCNYKHIKMQRLINCYNDLFVLIQHDMTSMSPSQKPSLYLHKTFVIQIMNMYEVCSLICT